MYSASEIARSEFPNFQV
ncbi:MAG: hypothetical protein E7E86_12375, partial [Staphylococcus sp.]|nr:hypothetical protein [Staphylococcus sp.]